MKFKLVIKGVSAGALPSCSPKDDWWVWGRKQAALYWSEGKIWPFSFLFVDEGLNDSDIVLLPEKAGMRLFIDCYTEKWYEVWQKINKHENATFTLFKIFLLFQHCCKSNKETQEFKFSFRRVFSCVTFVLILSVWIGIQEQEPNVESEYCAGTVNVYKCVVSAGSDYIQHEDKPEHKRNLETSGTGTFSSSELYFCKLLYLLLQIASLLAEPTANSRF